MAKSDIFDISLPFSANTSNCNVQPDASVENDIISAANFFVNTFITETPYISSYNHFTVSRAIFKLHFLSKSLQIRAFYDNINYRKA